MSVNQQFIERLEQAGFNRRRLTALMADIDEEKRSIKSRLSRLSSEPSEQHAKGRERQVLIRRMKDKMSFLTEEREMVRLRLGRIKMDQKALNRRTNKAEPEFAHAFMAAAERTLSEDSFLELEARAAEILQSKE